MAAVDGIPPGAAFGLLERAIGYALGRVQPVTSDELAAPTPCGAWDLRTLLDHVIESLDLLCGCLDAEGTDGRVMVGELDPTPSTPSATDPAAVFRSRATRLISACSRPRARPLVVIARGYPLSMGVVAATGAVEVTVHGWDIGRAMRQPRPIPHALASDLLWACPPLIVDACHHRLFAPPVAIPSTAGASDRLVAVLGRDPAATSWPGARS